MRQSKEKRFEKLYITYKDAVFRTALLYLKDYQLAEDAAQDAFCKALRKLGSLKDESKEKAWLLSITVNVCRDKLRRAARREVSVERLPEEEYSSAEDDRLTVTQAISALPPELREVVILHYYQEIPQVEIARMLKIPGTTVAYRLRTAKARLKDYLKEEFDE